MAAYDEFLAGNRPNDIALYFANSFLDNPENLSDYGVSVANGVILIVDGSTGRSIFNEVTGMQPMQFAQRAMQTSGSIESSLTSAECPNSTASNNHFIKFLFAFVEEEKNNIDGIYDQGDVMHVYAFCSCDTAFSDRWVINKAS
ncbi:MAG: DUF5807 family protein [Halobacteriaceae archaeon]